MAGKNGEHVDQCNGGIVSGQMFHELHDGDRVGMQAAIIIVLYIPLTLIFPEEHSVTMYLVFVFTCIPQVFF